MTMLVLVSVGAMVFAMGIFGAPPPSPGAPVPPLGTPPGAASEELGQDVRRAALLGATPLDVLLPDEHAASTIPSVAAAASIAVVFLLIMTFRLFLRRRRRVIGY